MAKEVIQGEGIRGMYRGLNGIWVKDIPGSFIYFGSYEAAKSAATSFSGTKHQSKSPIPYIVVFLSGKNCMGRWIVV